MKLELFTTDVPLNLDLINCCILFVISFIFTYEEYQVHHRQRLSMHRKLWHQLLFVLDQHRDNIEMVVFDLRLLHWRIHHQ